MSDTQHVWKHLERKPGSRYRQLFVKGSKIAARTLYAQHLNEPMTPEEVAADYDLPVEVVNEAIAYGESNPPEFREDWEMEERQRQRVEEILSRQKNGSHARSHGNGESR